MAIDAALVRLGQWLREERYRFVTVTPATHARVNARASAREAHSVEDVFGWSRPFRPSLLPRAVLDLLEQSGALERRGELFSTSIRFSTLDDRLYIHSAFPTIAADAVFFGPDTYRFAALIRNTLVTAPVLGDGRIIDIGCGAGAGGIVAAEATYATGTPPELIMTDINATALRHAGINASLAGIDASFRQCDLFAGIEKPLDLIVANPPYLVDQEARLYRHGGGALGSDLSLRIVREGIVHLAPGGRLILYTGSPILHGKDLLRAAIEEAIDEQQPSGGAVSYIYSELDSDVFGEELEMPAYADVDRIAAVGLVLTRPRSSAALSSKHPVRGRNPATPPPH